MYLPRRLASLGPKTITLVTVAAFISIAATTIFPARGSALCQAPAASFGSATLTLNVPATATYRVWTRMQSTATAANKYSLEVDGSSCYSIGGATLPANTWTWVDYQGGSITSKVELPLSQGNHSLKLIGTQAGVRIDRIVAESDLACVPQGATADCVTPGDKTVPTVTLTAPAANAALSGVTAITADAHDNDKIAKVEFYANSQLLGSDTSAPYTYSWDTSLLGNGQYSVIAKAYDATGNTATDSRTVTLKNGDAQAPSVPAAFTAAAVAYNRIELKWSASTDNVAVAGYVVTRNGVTIARLGTVTNYSDTQVSANTSYSYQVAAVDAAGNTSAQSAVATAKTANPTDGRAPSVPQNLTLIAVSSSQVNVRWSASTDNVGVTGYQVIRQTGVAPAQKIATVTTTSFGDTTLKPYTTYTYIIKAVDAAGNVSGRSQFQTVTTRGTARKSELLGTIRDTQSKPIPYATVSFVVDGKTHVYQANRDGKYDIDNVAGGSYVMVFQAKGYKAQTIARIVHENARVAQNAMLQKQ
ncbi:MAG TPA: Ig-like domain-containing protein [Candidatus Saccharimonadales bacterium]|nr:Ig-like domain-containing protein [Candidatus Saccharimonadales bacterium]